MKLLTDELKTKLLANGANRDQDHAPVVKFFNPVGGATWLIRKWTRTTTIGCSASVIWVFNAPNSARSVCMELEGITLKSGPKIDRGLHFKASHPMSYYVDRARTMGYIDA